MSTSLRNQLGSIELVVLGFMAAMIVVLAIPLLTGFEDSDPTKTIQAHPTDHTAKSPITDTK